MNKLLLTLVAFLCATVSAFAADTVTIGNITYSYEGTTATIIDGKNVSGALSIRSKITVDNKDYTVTKIGKEAFYGNTNITAVFMSNTITTIGEGAFDGCSNLTSVSITSSVTEIQSFAFWNCKSLSSVSIPQTVSQLGDYVFQNCTGLTEALIYTNAFSTSKHTFSGCTSLKNVYLANNVTGIGPWTFADCSSLTSFSNNNITFVGANAFRRCTNLKTFKASKVSVLDHQIFARCSNLRSIDLSSCPLTGITVDRTTSQTIFEEVPSSTLICLPEGNSHADGEVNVVIGSTCDKYVLTEGTPFNVPITKFTAKEIVYERSIPANSVSTFFLDYVPPTRDGVKYYMLDNVSGNTLTFKEVTELKANNPYLITTGNTAVSDFSVSTDTEVYWVNDTGAQYYGIGRALFIGNSEEKGFEELTSNSAQSSYVFSQNDMTWNRVTSSNKTVSVPPFRAFISQENDGTQNQFSTVLVDDETTGIQQIRTVDQDGTENYYDLKGRRLSQPQRGINIVNGKKVLMK